MVFKAVPPASLIDRESTMVERDDDYHLFVDQKRFLHEIEQSIRSANREIIHARLPELNRESILAFATAIGRLRARYLEAAFHLGVNEAGDAPDLPSVAEVKIRREMYEEARAAFEALIEGIEKGYIDVVELKRRDP
jgi:hypothetical protein